MAGMLTGPSYRCPAGKTPCQSGRCTATPGPAPTVFERVGRKLCIHHGSLGYEAGPYKTAFVLNLDFEPEIPLSLKFTL